MIFPFYERKEERIRYEKPNGVEQSCSLKASVGCGCKIAAILILLNKGEDSFLKPALPPLFIISNQPFFKNISISQGTRKYDPTEIYTKKDSLLERKKASGWLAYREEEERCVVPTASKGKRKPVYENLCYLPYATRRSVKELRQQ